jgi:hypothetical protein
VNLRPSVLSTSPIASQPRTCSDHLWGLQESIFWRKGCGGEKESAKSRSYAQPAGLKRLGRCAAVSEQKAYERLMYSPTHSLCGKKSHETYRRIAHSTRPFHMRSIRNFAKTDSLRFTSGADYYVVSGLSSKQLRRCLISLEKHRKTKRHLCASLKKAGWQHDPQP